MGQSTGLLVERLAEIGGLLQKLRWEALDSNLPDVASNIAHAIEAIAWAAGISASDGNVVRRPGDRATMHTKSIEIPDKNLTNSRTG